MAFSLEDILAQDAPDLAAFRDPQPEELPDESRDPIWSLLSSLLDIGGATAGAGLSTLGNALSRPLPRRNSSMGVVGAPFGDLMESAAPAESPASKLMAMRQQVSAPTAAHEIEGPPSNAGPAARLQAIRDAIYNKGNSERTGMISVDETDDLSSLGQGTRGGFSKASAGSAARRDAGNRTSGMVEQDRTAGAKNQEELLKQYREFQKDKLDQEDKIRKALADGLVSTKGLKGVKGELNDAEIEDWIKETAHNRAFDLRDPVMKARLAALINQYG